jgi:hypothetical protein
MSRMDRQVSEFQFISVQSHTVSKSVRLYEVWSQKKNVTENTNRQKNKQTNT